MVVPGGWWHAVLNLAPKTLTLCEQAPGETVWCRAAGGMRC